MPKKPASKKPVKGKKAIKKAMKEEAESAEFSAEHLADIAADIAVSPINNPAKALFLYTIAQGTFNLQLYERYQELLSEHREQLIQQAEKVKEDLQRLQKDHEETVEQLSEAAVGACREIQDACVHIEVKTTQQVEKLSEERKSGEVEAIRKKLKKK